MSLINPGTYPVRSVENFYIKETQKGSVSVNLPLVVGDGDRVKYTGWIKCSTPEKTKKSVKRVVQDLLNLGYKKTSLHDLSNPNNFVDDLFDPEKLKDVTVVVETERFENSQGEEVEFSRVKWVNKKTIKAMPQSSAIEVITASGADSILQSLSATDTVKNEATDQDVPF